MQGQLFTTDFLLRGICETDAWRALSDADLDAFIAGLKAQYATFAADPVRGKPRRPGLTSSCGLPAVYGNRPFF